MSSKSKKNRKKSAKPQKRGKAAKTHKAKGAPTSAPAATVTAKPAGASSTPAPSTPPAAPAEPVPGSGPLRLRATAITHQGKVRPNNEDCIGVCEWLRPVPMKSPVSVECLIDEPRLCVVADGLGGHVSGETASLMTVLGLSQVVSKLQTAEAVTAALRGVNKLLYDNMEESPDLRTMGATVVGLVIFETSAWLFNVGDSRGYALQSGTNRLRLLSTDDTTRRSLPSERTGLYQHSITQSLGGLSTFEEIEPHIVPCTIGAGDRFLLCSDGLTDMLDQESIERCLVPDSKVSVERLLTAALDEGGFDNCSIVLIDVLAPAPDSPG